MKEYAVLILRQVQKEPARLPGGAYEHVRDAIRALVIARRLEPPKQSPHVPHECSWYYSMTSLQKGLFTAETAEYAEQCSNEGLCVLCVLCGEFLQ